MRGDFYKQLTSNLETARAEGLFKEERIITSAQQADITVGDSHVINFCANNYLGLANHPELIAAAKSGMDSHGFGMASVRFICGTQDTHKQLEKKLAEYKAGLSGEERKKLIADTKHLKQYQEEPSPKEDLEKIPRLTRADLKKEAAPLLNRKIETEGVSIIAHEMDTNGIDYLTYLFDVCDILPEDLPYLGILKAVLGYVDTDDHSYAALANEINMYTGGIGSSIGIYPNVKKQGEIGLYYEVRTKVLASRLPDAMRLMKEILLTSHLADEKRIYEILAQLKSRLQAGLSASGHSVAYTRALSYFSAAAYCQDATAGIACYRVIADYEEKAAADGEAVLPCENHFYSGAYAGECNLRGVGDPGSDAGVGCIEKCIVCVGPAG